MAYKRYRSRRFKPRNRYRKRYQSKRFQRKVMRAVNNGAEKKCFGMGASNVPTSSSYFSLLSDVAEGTSDEQRVGNKIFIRYFKFRFLFATNGQSRCNFRLMVVRDRGAPTGSPAVPATIVDFIDYKRYQIIWDQTWELAKLVEDASASSRNHVIEKTLRIMKSQTWNSFTVAPNRPYFLFAAFDYGAVDPPIPTLTWQGYCTFTDV